MNYKEKLNDVIWSASTLNLYSDCPYAFYNKLICGVDSIDNFYSSNGKINHEIFQKLLNHEMTLAEAPSYYIEKFSAIKGEVKPNIMDNTMTACVEYLCDVEALDEKKYEIISVEDKFEFEIGKYKIVGYADAIIKKKDTKEILLIDHKAAGHFFKKNGDTLSNHKADFEKYKRQMYIYALGMIDKYGYPPDKMIWHHFRDHGKLSTISFQDSEMKAVKKWVLETIRKIYRETKFDANPEYFRCKEICSYRFDCEYSEW